VNDSVLQYSEKSFFQLRDMSSLIDGNAPWDWRGLSRLQDMEATTLQNAEIL
jgi:hypothetical protein